MIIERAFNNKQTFRSAPLWLNCRLSYRPTERALPVRLLITLSGQCSCSLHRELGRATQIPGALFVVLPDVSALPGQLNSI